MELPAADERRHLPPAGADSARLAGGIRRGVLDAPGHVRWSPHAGRRTGAALLLLDVGPGGGPGGGHDRGARRDGAPLGPQPRGPRPGPVGRPELRAALRALVLRARGVRAAPRPARGRPGRRPGRAGRAGLRPRVGVGRRVRRRRRRRRRASRGAIASPVGSTARSSSASTPTSSRPRRSAATGGAPNRGRAPRSLHRPARPVRRRRSSAVAWPWFPATASSSACSCRADGSPVLRTVRRAPGLSPTVR